MFFVDSIQNKLDRSLGYGKFGQILKPVPKFGILERFHITQNLDIATLNIHSYRFTLRSLKLI